VTLHDKIERRTFVKSAAMAAAASSVGLARGTAAQTASQPRRGGDASQPNILLIVADDQGGQMGCLGTPGLSTPHMDSLAEHGVLFTNTYCAFPSCSPARTSMFTGLHPHSHHTTLNVHEFMGPAPPPDWPEARHKHNARLYVPESVPTLVEVLKQAGYRSGITSKFHMAPHSKFPFDAWIKGNGPADVARFIQDAADQPLFLMHNIRSPHRPFRPFIERSGRSVIDSAAVKVPDYLPDTPLMRTDWAEYLTAVQVTDDQVGQTLGVLRESGCYDDTLIIFTGDNGPAFHRGKYSAYDFGLRVPLIVAGPGVREGVRSDALVSHIDLMPTIADYAGAASPEAVHGARLRPILEGVLEAVLHDVIVGEVHFGFGPGNAQDRAAFDGRMLYIRRINPDKPHRMPADNFQEEPWGNHSYQAAVEAKDESPLQYELLQVIEGTPPSEELFDLSKDPWCMRDLMADAAYAVDRDRMRARLDRWIDETGDEAFRGMT
jgi:N-sulfoglucosamine sulfohydrolase